MTDKDHVVKSSSNTKKKNTTATIKIISATYGPCENLQLSTGESTSEFHSSFPHTRDVRLFLQALLLAATRTELTDNTSTLENVPVSAGRKRNYETAFSKPIPIFNDYHPGTHSLYQSANQNTKSVTPFVFLLGNGGKLAMNAIFGDPCPGTSKRLEVHYLVTEDSVTEIHHDRFAEHEPVLLRQRLRQFQHTTLHSQSQHSGEEEEEETKPIVNVLEEPPAMKERTKDTVPASPKVQGDTNHQPTTPSWKLRPDTSEVILPLVLPFLKLPQRVGCRLVCSVWKNIVKDWGVATTIDCNDKNIARSFSRPFLRGILSHSYSSLKSLVLDGFESLEKEDLHPSIPHLRKLESLDLSRCRNLDDSTMFLLSQHIHSTLQVLYLKGLVKVSDEGVIAICKSCTKLQVLELSYVPVTDRAGIAIQHLPQLRALFMRDNYRVTDKR